MVGLEGLILQVSPLLINILLIEVVLLRWNKGRLQAFVFEVIPWEVAQPRVRFHLFSPVGSKAILWLSLDHLRKGEIGVLETGRHN